MDIIFYFLVGIIIIKVLIMIFNPSAIASEKLHKQMQSLGKIRGRTYNEIIKVTGKPTLYESNVNGYKCTWSFSKYTVVLGFDKQGICTGVLSEVKKTWITNNFEIILDTLIL